MKLLSIAIPCYNSEKYMRKCIDSLLVGGEDVEILIVDDGSTKDRTAEIADEYEAQFPRDPQGERWTRFRSEYRNCQCYRIIF